MRNAHASNSADVDRASGSRDGGDGRGNDGHGEPHGHHWALSVDTEQGTTTPSVTLEQNGSELTGHYSSETLGEADVKGNVNGNEVTFSLSANVQGYPIDVTYTGTVQDDGTLSGQISLGGLGGGTFTGKKR